MIPEFSMQQIKSQVGRQTYYGRFSRRPTKNFGVAPSLAPSALLATLEAGLQSHDESLLFYGNGDVFYGEQKLPILLWSMQLDVTLKQGGGRTWRKQFLPSPKRQINLKSWNPITNSLKGQFFLSFLRESDPAKIEPILAKFEEKTGGILTYPIEIKNPLVTSARISLAWRTDPNWKPQ